MEEKKIRHINGFVGLFIMLVLIIIAVFLVISNEPPIMFISIFIVIFVIISLPGFKILRPQEAAVFTKFGKYAGVLRKEGFFFINPFCYMINPAANTVLNQSSDVNINRSSPNAINFPSKKISLKIMTLNNGKQKVNDVLGNPVDIGVAVTWRIVNPAKAVFNVDNYKEYLSLQCDAAVRTIVRNYPYDCGENIDTTGDGEPDEGSLRGSTAIVAKKIKDEIQSKIENAGIEILEAKIIHLAYSPEIAAIMLQRQQATALVEARTKIVEGAVGMVEMALAKLEKQGIIELEPKAKAQMVSNLLVTLCANKETQPVINSGFSIE